MSRVSFAVLALLFAVAMSQAGETPEKSKAVKQDDQGKYTDKDGTPTYNVKPDGTVDWFTYAGFRLYHADCHVCHGPEGAGSSYAPALVDSLRTMTYEQFQDVVVNGRTVATAAKQSVMPAFGTNQNVICHLDDLYIYLRARADGALERGRPAKKEAKSEAARAAENECLGVKS
jgi:methanol metabolism-related c-type cytochrome